MINEPIEKWGPLAVLAGTWEGNKGDDVAPSDDRGTEKNLYRERMVFTPISPVNNHEQTLYGLRYSTTAWRIGETEPFHEDLGYYLWDPKVKQVYRCFTVPRGVAVLAGGDTEASAKEFHLSADVGSPTFGICSTPFLDREFKTIRYELKIVVHDRDGFSYESDTQIQMPGKPGAKGLFHHIDKNRLKRVES